MFTNEQQLLLDKFADLSDRLFDEGVISTDSFTGEIGEYVACRHFILNKSERVAKAVDGVCNSGDKYQIKAKVFSSPSNSFSVDKLKPNLFDYLVLVFFDTLYSPLKLVRVPASYITSDKFSLTGSNIQNFECVDKDKIILQPNIQKLLNEFAKTIEELKQQSITRSNRVVGDIGEFYASKRLDLRLSESKTAKGIDGINSNGLTFEIKTRRVYESGRRKSETRRLNGLVGKSADFLVVVTLDRAFMCAGMWLIPMTNLTNPKSANLRVVNNTIGTLNLIPSKISYLQTGDTFKTFDKITRV